MTGQSPQPAELIKALAQSMLDTFGERSLAVVDAQIAALGDDPAASLIWKAIGSEIAQSGRPG